jgi:hypothetical protein
MNTLIVKMTSHGYECTVCDGSIVGYGGCQDEAIGMLVRECILAGFALDIDDIVGLEG